MNDELLTVNEVAQILKIHPFTIRLWLKQGKLSGVKIGGRWRVRRSALEGFIGEVK